MHPATTTDTTTPLKLHTPGPPSAQPTPDWSLTDFWTAWARPAKETRRASPRYLKELAQSVGLWADATGDPPLGQITDPDCDRFLVALEARKIAPNTVRKHARHVQHLLDWAGPQSRTNRRPPTVDGLFGDDHRGRPRPSPWIEPPPPERNEPRPPYRRAHVAAILENCTVATMPTDRDACLYWRCLIVTLYNTGLRCESACLFAPQHVRGRWAKLPASIMKRRRHGQRLYLNRWARAALARIQPNDPAEPFFRWPHSPGWFHRQMKAILAAALPEEHHHGTHGLRRAILTWLTARNPAVAKLMAGHLSNDVTLRHYVAPKIVARLVERYPQPPDAWSPLDP